MRRLLNIYPSNIIRDSSFGGINRPFFISFQTSELTNCSIQPQNANQVDTIMSMSHTQYLQGQIYVTMTSTMDPIMMKQVPCIVTIHLGQTSKDYFNHFQTDNSIFYHLRRSGVLGSLSQLLSHYPGMTMDMSTALSNGSQESFADMCDKIFRIDDVSNDIFDCIQRLCTIHFTRNYYGVSKVSGIVPPDRRQVSFENSVNS